LRNRTLLRPFFFAWRRRASNEKLVIDLTFRHDRVGNFWFILMHELVHVGWCLKVASEPFVVDLYADPL